MNASVPGFPSDRPLTVVSSDGHAGPRLVEDLRPYCPKAYLERFDGYASMMAQVKAAGGGGGFMSARDDDRSIRLNKAMENIRRTAGHHDVATRLKDMDKDGVTAEVVFPTTHNGETEPFIMSDLFVDPVNGDHELMQVGMHIYAAWLADACKQAPDRLIGLVTPPLWDIEASIKEVEWAAREGLKGVFLLMPRPGFTRFDDAAWERFWATCADLGMNLNTHSGAPPEGGMAAMRTPAGIAAMEIESGGWPARKAMHQLIFSGVFERHPTLKIAFTEQNFDWWSTSVREFDSTYLNHKIDLDPVMSRKPSEYMATNVYIGASFLAPFEAEDAVRHGYTDNVMWGRDYGHIEGTFVVTEDDNPATNPGRLSMRYAFANIPPADVKKMVSDNALRFYNLDEHVLAKVAEQINAPSLLELTTPIQAIPDNGGILAFRTVGAWH